MLICYLCFLPFSTSQTHLKHLRLNHAIHHVGVEVRCGQDGCPKTCISFRYLKLHIEKDHGYLLNSDVTEQTVSCSADNSFSQLRVEQLDGDIDDDCMDVDCSDSADSSINLTTSYMNFVGQLQSKANLSLANVQLVTENMKVFLTDVAEQSCREVKKLLASSPDVSADSIKNCLASISDLPTFIAPVDSDYKRWIYMKNSGFLIEPVQVSIGTRFEKKYVVARGCRDDVMVEDTMQYIPIETLLAMIMLDSDSANLMSNFKTQCARRDSELIGHYFHTQTCKEHPFFRRYSDAFALHLYVDGFEVTNPLGSHTSVHKMEALYLVVQNFPGECQSKLSSIFLIALWYAIDVKKYQGYDNMLAPVINSLLQLESENGISVTIKGKTVLVRACLVMLSADNLGYNSIFGFSESFNARKFCRFCETTRSLAETCFEEQHFVLRTRQSYDNALSKLNTPEYVWSETGIKHSCPLNQLKYFHVTSNMCVDIMHDLLEGVAPYELSLIFEALRLSGYITLDQLNSAIASFDYSSAEIGSRPPDVRSLTSLKMSASEMWCFLRVLPRLIGHLIPREEPHWKLLLLFLDICDIVFSPVITTNLCSYLSHLIVEHHAYFKEVCPQNALLPKHHFMVHYPRCLVNSGPSIRYWCMRFEARHNFFKELGRISRCYKNICKTLAKRFQFALAVSFMSGQLHTPLEHTGTSTQVLVDSLTPEMSTILTQSLGLCKQDTIYTLKSVDVGHYTFKENNVAILSVHDGVPTFGLIVKIFNVEQQNYFLMKKYQTCHCDEHFHAYVVIHGGNDSELCIVLLKSLTDHVPLQFQSIKYESIELLCVSPRHILF